MAAAQKDMAAGNLQLSKVFTDWLYDGSRLTFNKAGAHGQNAQMVQTSRDAWVTARDTAWAEIHKEFSITREHLARISAHMVEETIKGAHSLAAFQTGRPTGREIGTYYAVELGEVSLRLYQLKLKGDGTRKLQQDGYLLPYAPRTGQWESIFDFVAKSTCNFLLKCRAGAEPNQPAIGFLVLLPFTAKSNGSGILTGWVTGFRTVGVEGVDVAQLLQEALARHKVKAKVTIIISGTAATLVAQACSHPDTDVAITMTGSCSAAYYAPLETLTDANGQAAGEIIMNVVWGAYNNKHKVLHLTQYDNKIDWESSNPSQHVFEKLASSKHVGKIVQNILVSLVDKGLIFNGRSAPGLKDHYALSRANVRKIDADDSEGLERTSTILEEAIGLRDATFEDRVWVKEIVQLVATRAARLCGAAIHGILESTSREICHICVESFSCQILHRRLAEALVDIMGTERAAKVKITVASEPQGVGAALCTLAERRIV